MSIVDLLVPPRKPTPDERVYLLLNICPKDLEKKFYESFHGRFDNEHFIPQQHRDTHSVVGFLFSPLYLHLDCAFGKEFRDSIDAVVANTMLPCIARAIEYIPEGKEKALKDKYGNVITKRFPKSKVLTGNIRGFDFNSQILSVDFDNKQVEALRKKKDQRAVSVRYHVSEISNLLCELSAAGHALITFRITPKSELKKEDRTYPGYEFRYYRIRGSPNHLNQLEKGFAYMASLGEDGHTSTLALKYHENDVGRLVIERLAARPKDSSSRNNSRIYRLHGASRQLDELERAFDSLRNLAPEKYISLGYDGDGNARMSFARFDEKPLAFPDELFTYWIQEPSGSINEKQITVERFKSIIKKGEKAGAVSCQYNDEGDREGRALLVLGKNRASEGKFHPDNQANYYVID